jgi:methyltransferase (TIGR00027 family)
MKTGLVSRTALNVASSMVTLGAKPGWHERLPAGLPELSEALLLASRQFPFGPGTLRLAQRPAAVRMAELGERLQPGTFTSLGRRKIFMDQQVLAAIDAGASQVLVLGAGFDTLGLRLAPLYPELSFIELDHPATSRVKARAVRELGESENLALVAADLARMTLSDVLRDCAAWDSSARAVVVAEGLLYYLSRASVRQLFAELSRSSATGTRVAFSHLFDLHRFPLARAALRLGGEPWLSASESESLPDYVGPGWKIIASESGQRRREIEAFAVAEKMPGKRSGRAD